MMDFIDCKKITLIIIIMAVSTQMWPYTIKGRITMNNRPVPEIDVNISDKDGNRIGQASTDSKGAFMIDHIDHDKIAVKATGEGYVPIQFEVVTGKTDTDLGILSIEKITNLEDVTISAGNILSTPGKTMVYTSRTDKERAASPFNMLSILSYKAPQIRVRESERTLTIEGEEPQILVNGIKRDMSFISSIDPKAIVRIEFSNMPDIRFGRRCLNIIIQQPTEGGRLMADLTGAVSTPRYFLAGVAEYTKNKNDFMLYYNGGYRHGRKEYTDEEEKYIGGAKDITLGVDGKPSSTSDRYHSLNFYFTRQPSEKSMFVTTASLDIKNYERSINGCVTSPTQSYDRINDRGYRYLRPSLSLYYLLTVSNTSSIEIDAIGSYSYSSSHRNLGYSTGYSSRLSANSPIWHFSTEGIWRKKLPFAQLNTGIGISYNNASNEYIIDGISSHQTSSSIRLNAYASVSGYVLTVGYDMNAGLGYYKVKNGIFSPDLMLSLQKRLDEKFSLSYSFRYNPQMPSMSSYNETLTPVNNLMYHIGAQNLKAQQNLNNQVQIRFNVNKFYISLQSTLNNIFRPLVTEYSCQDNPESPFYGFFMETPDNGRSFMSYGADCNVGVSNLWNFLSLRASAGWGHSHIKMAESFTVCSWYLDFNAGLYWKGWQLNMTAENLVPSWSMWGLNEKIRRWPYTSLAIYKNLGNWNLYVAWSNLFSRYGGRYRTETLTSVAPRSSEFRMNDQGNMLEIGVRYQFTTGRLLSKKRRTVRLSGEGENGVRWDY